MKRLTLFLVFLLIGGSLFGQSVFNDWRRNNDPMVAQPGGGYFGLYSNPAATTTYDGKPFTTFGFSQDSLVSYEALQMLLDNPVAFVQMVSAGGYDDIGSAGQPGGNLFSGGDSDPTELGNKEMAATTAAMLNSLPEEDVDALFNGGNLTALRSKAKAGTLSEDDIKDLDDSDLNQLSTNFDATYADPAAKDRLMNSVVEGMIDEVIGDEVLGPLSSRIYLKILEVGYADGGGFSLGGFVGLKYSLQTRGVAPGNGMNIKTTMDAGGQKITIKKELPINMQTYFETTIKGGYSFDFSWLGVDPLNGLRVGFAPRVSFLVGVNHKDIESLINKAIEDEVSFESLYNIADIEEFILNYSVLSWGIDLGATYNFGSLLPGLDFLNAGLTLTDVIGFNHKLSPTGLDSLDHRYAIDMNFGVYLDFEIIEEALDVYAGVDMIGIIGMALPNPYALYADSFDHFRFLAGVGLLNRSIDISLQYYSRALTLMADFWIGKYFNFGVGGGLTFAEGYTDPVSAGAEIHFTVGF